MGLEEVPCCCCCWASATTTESVAKPAGQNVGQYRTCVNSWQADCFGPRQDATPNELLCEICRDLKFGRYGASDVKKVLAAGADASCRDLTLQYTPLHFAAKVERKELEPTYLEICRMLLGEKSTVPELRLISVGGAVQSMGRQ